MDEEGEKQMIKKWNGERMMRKRKKKREEK